MSAEQSQKERVSPKEQVVWHRDMSTEQKMHAMGAAAEHFEAIAAGVNIKFSRSENSVPAVKVYKMLTSSAFDSFFIEHGTAGPTAQTFEWYKENENDPLVGYCLLDFSTETKLTYKPLKKDGKPAAAKQKEQDTREAGDDQRDFETGDIYQVDGFLRTPEKLGGTLERHDVELRSFLSRLEGYQLFLQLDDTEVTELEDDIVVPSVASYRLDLLFATPLGVTVKVRKTPVFPVLTVPCSDCSLFPFAGTDRANLGEERRFLYNGAWTMPICMARQVQLRALPDVVG